MTAPGRRRATRVTALLLILAATLGGWLAGRPADASGKLRHTAAAVTVTVDTMAPVSATDGTTLTVRGTIRNAGGPETGLRLVVGVGVPDENRTSLERDFADPPPLFRVLATCAAQCLAADLAAGDSETYAVTMPLGQQLDEGLTTVYPLLVRVEGGGGLAGQATTFLPYVPGAVAGPLRVSWLVPLDPAPALAVSGAVDDPSFPASIGAGGPLATTLAATVPPAGTRPAGDQPGYAPVTWAVEPSLLEAATTTTRSGWLRTGTPARHTADAGSARFLATLAAQTRGHAVLALPYGDPDAEAVTRAGLGLDLSSALTLGRSTLAAELPQADVLSSTAWVPGSAIDMATLDTYAAAGVTTLVIPGGQLPATETAFPASQSAVTPIATQGSTVRALVTDPDIEALLTAAGRDQPTARMAAERLLAVLAVSLGEAPNDSSARDVVLALPRGVSPDASWLRDVLSDTGSVPWLRAVRLPAFDADPASERQPLQPYPAAAQSAELPQAVLVGTPGSVSALRDGVAALASSLPDTTTLTRPMDLALFRAESAAWRTDPAGGLALREEVAGRTRELLGGIRLSAAPTVTLGSRNAQIPVTVENLLDEPVSVTVQLSSTDRTKLDATSAPVTVGPGHKQRVLLRASTQRAGTFRATVRLTTASGLAIASSPVTVHSQAYGALSIGITLGALAVLLVAVVVRTVRRLRRRGTA